MPKIFRSIRVRLMLWHLSVIAVLLFVFSLILYWSVAQSLYREIDLGLSAQAEAILGELDIIDGQYKIEEDKISQFVTSELIFQISDLTGNILIRSANLKQEVLPPLSAMYSSNTAQSFVLETVTISAKPPLRLITMFSKGNSDDPSVVIRVGQSLGNTQETLARLRFGLLTIVPILLALASLASFFLANRYLRPLQIMAQSAEQISERDLAQRLPIVNPHDEIGHLADTFNRLFERLQGSFKSQQRFVSDASHELRTPLTILRGKLEVALRKARSTQEYQGILETALAQSERLSELVENLLLLARADSGAWHPQFQRVDLAELCAELHVELQPLAQSKKIRFTLSKTNTSVVNGHKELLRQMILNLLDNAIKYTPRGGTVRLAISTENQCAQLTIYDTGVGIQEQDLSRIFERFYQIDKARTQQTAGAGLGLSIVQEIVNLHQGKIQVESTPGQGSIFRVSLPSLTEIS